MFVGSCYRSRWASWGSESVGSFVDRLRCAWQSKHPAAVLARIALLVPAVGLLALMWFEESLIFFPERYPVGNWKPAFTAVNDRMIVPQVEDVWVESADGTRIHGWFATPVRGTSKEAVHTTWTILWCHGNAGNLSQRTDRLERLMQLPAQVMIFDYRGYGKSEGRIAEQGAYDDAEAAWSWLVETRQVAPEKIAVLGVSLGGGIATELARRVNPGKLMIESSFTSIPDMAAETYPFVPRMLVRTQLNSLARVPNLKMPKLFVHSRGDEIIPFHLGQALFDAAAEPKTFYELPNCRHNETVLCGGAAYLDALREFVQSGPKPD